jgi:hypothetical protein
MNVGARRGLYLVISVLVLAGSSAGAAGAEQSEGETIALPYTAFRGELPIETKLIIKAKSLPVESCCASFYTPEFLQAIESLGVERIAPYCFPEGAAQVPLVPLDEQIVSTPSTIVDAFKFFLPGMADVSLGRVFGTSEKKYLELKGTLKGKDSNLVIAFQCNGEQCGIAYAQGDTITSMLSFALIGKSSPASDEVPSANAMTLTLDAMADISLHFEVFLSEEAPAEIAIHTKNYEAACVALRNTFGRSQEDDLTGVDLPDAFSAHSAEALKREFSQYKKSGWLHRFEVEGQVALIIDAGDMQVYLNKGYFEGYHPFNAIAYVFVGDGREDIIQYGVLDPLRRLMLLPSVREAMLAKYKELKQAGGADSVTN